MAQASILLVGYDDSLLTVVRSLLNGGAAHSNSPQSFLPETQPS